jgi:hypothetical protein
VSVVGQQLGQDVDESLEFFVLELDVLQSSGDFDERGRVGFGEGLSVD